MNKTLALAIAALVVLTAAARPITAIMNAITPLVIVVGVLLLAWQLVQYFNRR